MPIVKATVTGSFSAATRTMGISGVSIARAPVTPLSARVSEEGPAGEGAGAENANLMPLRANSTRMNTTVATPVAAAR